MIKLSTLVALLLSLSAFAALKVEPGSEGPKLSFGGVELLSLSSPWVADSGWKNIYRFPEKPEESQVVRQEGKFTVRESRGAHGLVVQKTTLEADSITVRYDFDFTAIDRAEHLQWVLVLRPELYDGTMVSAQTDKAVPVRPLGKANLYQLRRARLILPTLDMDVEVSAADGEWKLQDARKFPWAKCYRLEYNRDFSLNGSRKTWVEVKFAARAGQTSFPPLTQGESTVAKGIPFQLGSPLALEGAKLAAVALWHTADGNAAQRGDVVGEMEVKYSDHGPETVSLRWEENVTAANDDPRDLGHGLLVPSPDNHPAWITSWRNPHPEQLVTGVSFRSLGAGWRALAATGIQTGGDQERLEGVLGSLRPSAPPAEETVVSLDGTWQFDPEGERSAIDVPVPFPWEQIKGCRNVHAGSYRRLFDLPTEFQGRRIVLRFDAVGEFCEVRVNGLSAGGRLVGPVPVEFDITGLVSIPSKDNQLEVLVKDDTHFSVPKPSKDWRNRRHWIPHGIGGNNRKGLFQSVSLRARPQVHIADVRIQTSVREKRIRVIYEIFNAKRLPETVVVGGTVRQAGSSEVALTLPVAKVKLGGQMTTVASVDADWKDPQLWQPNHPHLYELRSIIRDQGDKRLQRVDTHFGFREVWFEGIHFYLNGIRCNLRGESPSYSRGSGELAEPDAAEAMVRKALAANFNVLRFHALPAPPHVYDICDRLGMLVIDESAIYASWGMIMPEHPRWLPECREHLRRWVRRDRNHPSVVLWSGENEGLNCSQLSPAQLAEFARVIDSHDGTRPILFDGDGTGYGASPASVKHYVRLISDLEDRGGKASGYGRDLRDDIYWAAAYKQEIPLGIGEFLFPANEGMKSKRAAVYACMGLQTRGYRYANWFDIRPYNPHYTGGLNPAGPNKEFLGVWDLIVKSFAPVAVFDKDYDALGPFPAPPELKAGVEERRTLIVYNDTFADESVGVVWTAKIGGKRIGGGEIPLQISLGAHTEVEIAFTPEQAGELELLLTSRKGGEEQFRDSRSFVVKAGR